MANNVLTRIQNNQITDGTINAQYKVATGSITGNLIASNVTIQSNITILGNLTVSNSFTQLNSINTYINDPLVVFNNGYTGTPSYDVGILVNRNLQSVPGYGSVNAAWVWKEADAAFEALATTETGTTAGSMNNSGWANVKLGNTTAVSGTVTNSLTVGTTLGVTGAATLSSTLGVTGVSTLNGNVVAASGTASTSTTTGALVVVGGAGVSGNATIGGDTVITGDAYVQGGDIWTSATTFNLVNVTATTVNFAGAATTLNTGNASGVTNMAGVTKHLGNVVAASGTASTNTTTGALVVAGGAGISGAVNIGGALGITGTSTFTGVGTFNANLVAASGTASTNTTTGALVVAGGAGISGATYIGGLINVTGAATLSSTVAVSGVTTLNGNVVAASGTASTTTTTGALVVVGGAGISGAVNIGGALGVSGNLSTAAGGLTTSATTAYVFNETATTLNVGAAATTINVGNASGTTNASGVVKVAGNLVAASGTASTNTTTGALVVAGGAGISGAIYAGSVQNTPIGSSTASTGAFTTVTTSSTITSSGNIVAAATTASTSSTTGALVVKGGVGVAGDVNIAGNLAVNGTLTYINTTSEIVSGIEIVAGNLVANSGTVSSNTTTGALVVAGGAGISGAMFLGGALTSSGNINDNGGGLTTSQTTGYLFNETVTTLNVGSAATALNLGATSGTATLANPTLVGTQTTQNVYNTVATTVNAFGAATTLNVGNASGVTTIAGVTKHSGNLVAASGTASTTTTTGALVVAGGAGISGNLNVGTTSSIHNIQGNVLIGLGPIGPSADSAFTINQNSNVPIYSGAIMHIAAADSTNGAISIDTYGGNTVSTTYSGRHARGSSSAPSAVQATDVLSAFIGKGYGATGFANIALYNSAGVVVVANETFTDSSQATKVHLNYIQSGSTSGAAGLVVDSTGNVIVTQGTASTSFTTGALIVKGGVGVAGAAFLNDKLDVLLTTTSRGNLVAAATTVSSSATTGALVVVGGAGIGGNLYVGNSVFAGQGSLTAGQFLGNYSDGVVVDYVSPNGRISVGPSDNLIFYSGGPATTQTLSIGSTGVLTATGNIVGASGTTSTSSTTGAIVAVGGVGVSGNLNVGGITTVTGNVFLSNAVTINSSQTAGQDFVVKGKNDSTLIWARPSATYDQVLIGNSATTSTLVTGAKLIINSSDSIILPVGSNAQRPSSTGGTDVAGMFRYSTQVNGPEYYNGSVWNSITSSFTIITDEQFNGTGSQTAYTMAGTTTTAATIVSINGVMQIPTLAYSVSGTTLTFTEAPASTDIIDVRRLTTTQTISGIASTNGYMQFQVDNYGANVYTGTSSTIPTTSFNSTGAAVSFIPNVSVASANTATTIDTIDNTQYRSAKYVVQITNGAKYQVQEVLVVSDGTTASALTYGTIQTNGNLGVMQATQSGTNTLIQFIAANATNNVRIKKDYIAI